MKDTAISTARRLNNRTLGETNFRAGGYAMVWLCYGRWFASFRTAKRYADAMAKAPNEGIRVYEASGGEDTEVYSTDPEDLSFPGGRRTYKGAKETRGAK